MTHLLTLLIVIPLAGLVPRPNEIGGCPERPADKAFGDVPDDGCRPLSLVYVQEEPWAGAAARIGNLAYNFHSGAPTRLSSRARK